MSLPLSQTQALVVGAGIGGLAAAIALARQGAAVTVFESASAVGGKMRTVTVGDVKLDAGPTVLTMPWVFDTLLDGGLAATVEVEELTTIARHVWGDGTRLDLFTSRERSADAIAEVFGRRERDGFLRFCAYAAAIFDESRESFLASQRPTMASLLRESGWNALKRTKAIDPFRTMAKALGDHFREPRLLQLFGRYATYAGSSPFAAPATLNSIAHVESTGVMRVRGGMHQLAVALAGQARSLGVDIALATPVERLVIAGGRIEGLVTGGREHRAPIVVMNGEPTALADGALGPSARKAAQRPRERSYSAVTWCTTEEPNVTLEHHNVYFSDATEREFTELARRVPDDPTVYVCAQERGLLVLVNAPAHAAEQEERWRQVTVKRLAASGLRLALAPTTSVMTAPADFARLFPGSAGALYGAASHGWKAFFERPGARTSIHGLYLAGGSAHPGAGVPMVAISGQLAAQAAIADFASTSMSSITATLGGTSMRPVTTVRMH